MLTAHQRALPKAAGEPLRGAGAAGAAESGPPLGNPAPDARGTPLCKTPFPLPLFTPKEDAGLRATAPAVAVTRPLESARMQARGGDGRPTLGGNGAQVSPHFVNSGQETKALSLRERTGAPLSQKALLSQMDKNVQAWVETMGHPTLRLARLGSPRMPGACRLINLAALASPGTGLSPNPGAGVGEGRRATLRIRPPTASEVGT